jgi:hypothetical protein
LPEGGEMTAGLFMRRDWFELLTKSFGKCGEVTNEVKSNGI